MRKKLLYYGIVFAFIGVCGGILFNIFHVRHMPFQFECAVAINVDTYAPWHFHYVSTEEEFRFWICNHQTTDNLPPLINNPDLSPFDFARYDYLLFAGKRLTDLRYSPWLSHTEDAICRHEDARIPLIPSLEESSTDSLYIYKIEQTTKYRLPGP